MNKKIFGIKISTILIFFVCLLAAVLIWVYMNLPANEAVVSSLDNFVV